MKPNTNEYVPLAEKYISLVPDGSLCDILQKQQDDTLSLLSGLSEEQADYSYAPGKWSVKQVIGHIADVERLWSYRVMRISRGDAREFPGYDRDVFVQHSPANHIPFKEVLRDYAAVRQSTITLIAHLPEEALQRLGEFSEHPLSARAAAYVIAGHEAHHLSIIKERYLIGG